jgi:hypothetical protein
MKAYCPRAIWSSPDAWSVYVGVRYAARSAAPLFRVLDVLRAMLGGFDFEEEDVGMVRGGVCVGWTRGSCICVALDGLLQETLAPPPPSSLR